MQMVLRRGSGLLISSDEFMKKGPSHQYVRRSWVALEVPGRENTHYESCLTNLKMAHIGRRTYTGPSRNSYPQQHTYSGAGQNQSYGKSSGGSSDAAHHAAGHTHHHGH